MTEIPSTESRARPPAGSVLITGPVHSIEEYAAAASEAGWKALPWPLLAVTPTDIDLVELIDGLPDWICVTSANALPALERASQEMPELLTTRFACVGDRTAIRARSIGFKPTLPPARDAESLGAQLLETLAAESVVLWPRGPLSRELGQALGEAGHTVLDPIVYEVRTEDTPAPEGAGAARAILLASPSAVDVYVERERPGPGTRLTAIAIGRTTARTLEDHGERFDAILPLERPSPEAFQALLVELDARSDS